MYANTDIRRFARANGIPLWMICRELKISEPTMTRRLRKELPENEKSNIRKIIEQLSQQEQEASNGQ